MFDCVLTLPLKGLAPNSEDHSEGKLGRFGSFSAGPAGKLLESLASRCTPESWLRLEYLLLNGLEV